jgi:hypothetical protein
MAWGLFHGMRLYVDAIDMNWPGILLLHVVAYLMAGTASWGIRGMDMCFQCGLLCATAYLLAAWRVPRAMRLLVGCGYLMSYLATGWWWTAQRESFNWPLWVIGTLPFTVLLGPRDCVKPVFGRWAWLGMGVVLGFSLWIKPTPALPLVVVAGLALLLCDKGERAGVVRGGLLMCVGIGAVSLAFLLALAALGSLGGFVHWGIGYAFGSYAKAALPWSMRLVRAFRTAVSPGYRPVTLVLAVVGIAVAMAGGESREKLLTTWRRPMGTAAVLVIATAMMAMLQGKAAFVYHYLPMRWSFALFAGVIWGVVQWNNLMRRGANLASAAIIAITFFSLHAMGPTVGTQAAWAIGPMLRPSDQVIMWGGSTTLLAELKHRTPFPIVGSAMVYWFTPPASPYRREMLDLLAKALRNPSVQFLLIEQGDLYTKMPTPERLQDILDGDAEIRETIGREYRLMPSSTVGGFDVLEHVGG